MECYFQFTVQSFGGILQGCKLSMVFDGDHDLSMLHNQFSLFLTDLGIPFHHFVEMREDALVYTRFGLGHWGGEKQQLLDVQMCMFQT